MDNNPNYKAEAEEALKLLGAGYSIGEVGDDLHLVMMGPKLSSQALDWLRSAGFVEMSRNGSSNAWISDEGKKAFLKSTDEMGDGKIVWPKEQKPGW